MTKNITLSVDENVLAKVRRIAVDKDTTVNAIVREFLVQLSRQEDRSKEAVRRMREISEEAAMEVGPREWSRSDLYDR